MKNHMKKVALLMTAISTTATLTISPLTVKAADKSGIDAFVTRMYEVCLDRKPNANGLSDWSNRLENGQAKGSDIAFGFIFSQEFQNMNLCNEHYVNSMYKSFFDREGDAAGKSD